MEQKPHFTITPPMRLLEETIETVPYMFVKKMIVPWIENNFQVVAHLSRIDVQKKYPEKGPPVYWKS